MSKQSRRASRRNRPNRTGAFGSNLPPCGNSTTQVANSRAETCPYPYLFNSENSCCMCRGKISTCPCTPQDAINHHMLCHVTDKCEAEGHPSVFQMMAMGLPAPTVACRNCAEVPQFGGFGMSTDFGPEDHYGLPEKATRQWIAENSEPDELGTVRLPADQQDDLTTHATYWPECDHIEDCECNKDESVMWTLQDFSG